MLRAQGTPFVERDGQIYIRDRRRIMTYGPLMRTYDVSDALCKELLQTLGGWWVQWTRPAQRVENAPAATSAVERAVGRGAERGAASQDESDGESHEEQDDAAAAPQWYAVICRRFVPLEENPYPQARREIRRGLKDCRFERVTLDVLIEKGYEIQAAAYGAYADPTGSAGTRESFRANLERERGFDHLRHYWLVSRGDIPIAFAKTILHGKEEVDYGVFKSHPDYHRHQPNTALIHEMNRHYLVELGFEYASDGQRSLAHGANFQTFLVRKLQFERAPLDIFVRYRRTVAWGMKLARPFRARLGRLKPAVRAVLELDRFAVER